MKRFIAITMIALIVSCSSCAETFGDLQQEVNRTAPVNYDTRKLHVFSGTVVETNYRDMFHELKIAVDDDGSNVFLPYWSDYPYFIARFAGNPEDCHYNIGDHIEITGTLQPRYSSVRVIWLDVVAINGNEDF